MIPMILTRWLSIFSKKILPKKESPFDVELIEGVLTEEERELLLQQSIPLLREISEDHPGLQTQTNLPWLFQQEGYYNPFPKLYHSLGIKEKLDSAWVNRIDHTTEYPTWHHHLMNGTKVSAVYMLDNPDSVGTCFLIDGTEFEMRAKTNDMLVFPSHLVHSPPPTMRPRYSLAMDFQ